MALIDHLPGPLAAAGPRGLTWAQWLALPVLFLVAWVVGLLLGRATRGVLSFLVRRTRVSWDDQVVASLDGPLALAWSVAAASLLLPVLGLHGAAERILEKILRTAVFVAFFWFLLRMVRLVGEIISRSSWAQGRSATRSLVPLGAKILQVGVVAMAVVAILADLGYPVASLVAGLGIGGLALALAGQKTVENLFGAFSIGVDQPFRVGDVVSVEGVQGTVELIGLRSTRIRTAERTIVTIPNGKLADMRIESFAARDRIRLASVLGLSRATTAAQMREALSGIEGVLRAQPKLHPEGLVVRFRGILDSALEIEVQAYFQTADFPEFQAIRQDVLLAFMDVMEKAGTSFAVPTRVVKSI